MIRIALLILLITCSDEDPLTSYPEHMKTIPLPAPETTGEISVEQSLHYRRSVREFSATSLSLKEIGQLAWAAQGVNDELTGFRTAPSAGATHPMEVYLATRQTPELDEGVYRYLPVDHALESVLDHDPRERLHAAALSQPSLIDAPVILIITGVLERIEQRYGERAMRYMYMEAGHIAQNVYLQAVPLHIGTVVVGAFDDEAVREVLDLPQGEFPMYLMPIGKSE